MINEQNNNKIKEVLDKYKDKLAARGHNISSGLIFLGSGQNGSAFQMSNGKVLKVTIDENEAKSSALLINKRTQFIGRVYDVFLFGKTGFFGIVMENLDKLTNKDEIDFWNELNDSNIIFHILSTSMKSYSWEELKPKMIEKMKKSSFYSEKNEIEWFFQDAERYNLPQMIDELNKYGIVYYDFHSENIMKRGDRSVVIDLGYSKQKKQEKIPVIEKITKGYLKKLIKEVISK